ncbi:MAG: Glycosyltransferase AglI [Methanocella sp. PtaU1.Bin125]|nr:MAG: Glycosyltransferase AglI [Methanocella sp. PtaU1.Bin125]
MPMTKQPKVAIVILNWNGREDTAECLESLRNISYTDTVTIVVDNGSTDGSAAYIKARYPHVVMVETGRNLGYAGGNNAGIRYALEHFRPEYVFVLNNDTIVDRGFLERLTGALEADERAGIAGPKVRFYHDPARINAAGARMVWHLGIARNIGLGQYDDGRFNTEREVDCVYGCGFLIKSKVIDDVGLLDEKFFILLEETDWCLRARKAGYRIVYVPGSVIYHKEGISGKAQSPVSVYYGHRNRLLLIKKNYTPLMMAASAIPVVSMLALTAGYYLSRRDFRMIGILGKAYYDGLSMM